MSFGQSGCQDRDGLPISARGRSGADVAKKIQILGWVLFIVSACAFIASSLRSGDTLGLLGGIFFLLACFVFLIPFGMKDGSD